MSQTNQLTEKEPAQLEAGLPTTEEKTNVKLVDWDGPDDTANPLNWAKGKRWAHIVMVAILGLIPNMAATMIAPGVGGVVSEFKITSDAIVTLSTTIFLLGLAFGPLIFSSFSEVYGRAPVFHTSGLVFIAFLIGNAKSNSTTQFMVCRFFSGLAGGLPVSLGGGTIADITPLAERGLATALFSLGPLAGPVLGPVIGGFLAAGKGWRWDFWLLAILSGASELAALIIMCETSAKVILDRKAKRLRKSTGDLRLRSKLAHVVEPKQVLIQALFRPTSLLFRSPVVLALSLYAALVFGVIYILLTTFDDVFRGQYGFSEGTSGLAYLGLGVALVLGVFLFAFVNPRAEASRMKAEGLQQPRPEHCLLLMIWLSPFVAVGLLIYGWSAQYKVHWIAPIIGTFFIGLGAYFVLMPAQLYIIKSFKQQAASALGAYNLLRYIGGTFVPLAGPRLYNSLHLGWGNTLLAFLALVFVLAPMMFYRYGERPKM
ncbi:MFS general substrate transporter [Aureobasidium subglaciale]|nr:MFS general substrate transporter [Aureobasidium subglaciale]